MPTIIDDTRHDDPAFMKKQIIALKENLMGCHNELEMVYGELSQALSQNKKLIQENNALKVELSIHGIKLK